MVLTAVFHTSWISCTCKKHTSQSFLLSGKGGSSKEAGVARASSSGLQPTYRLSLQKSVGRSRLYELYQYFFPLEMVQCLYSKLYFMKYCASCCGTDGIQATSALVLVMWWGKSWFVRTSYSIWTKNVVCSKSLDTELVILSENRWADTKSCLSIFICFLYESCE